MVYNKNTLKKRISYNMSDPITQEEDDFDIDSAFAGLDIIVPLGKEETDELVKMVETVIPITSVEAVITSTRLPLLGKLFKPIKSHVISRLTTTPPSQDVTKWCRGCQDKFKRLPLKEKTQKNLSTEIIECGACRGLKLDTKKTITYSDFSMIARDLTVLNEVIGSHSYHSSYTLVNKKLQKVDGRREYIEVDEETERHIVVNKFHISELQKQIATYIKKMDQRKSNQKVQFENGGMMSACEGITHFNYINYVNFYNMMCDTRAMYTVVENVGLI
jgi:hypothetical protein